jgi:hypothetical protein
MKRETNDSRRDYSDDVYIKTRGKICLPTTKSGKTRGLLAIHYLRVRAHT